MPKLTPQHDRVILYGMLNPDVKEFDVFHQIKLTQMVHEIIISEDYCRSDIIVADMGNYSLAHILKVSVPYVKKFELCVLVSSLVIRDWYNRTSNIVISYSFRGLCAKYY
jgi:hypothetical protein